MRINRLKKDHVHRNVKSRAKMINIFKNPQAEMLQGFAIALFACLIMEPIPLYLMHSFHYFEIQFLAFDALVIVTILAYSLTEIKNRIVDFLAGFTVLLISFFTLCIMLIFPLLMIMHSITGTFTVIPFNPMFFISSALLLTLYVTIFVPKNIEPWCIPAASGLCYLVVAVWSFLKLHGQG